MKKNLLTVLVALIAAFMMQASRVESDTVSVDSDGSFREEPDMINTVDPTHQTELDISILIYQPYRGVVDRLRGLGYTVTEAQVAADLNQANLRNYNVLWIGFGTLPSDYEAQNDEIRTWVNEDGGGLIITQPNSAVVVSVFPTGYEVSIYHEIWPDNFQASIWDNNHPITLGLLDEDLSGNYDWVRSQDIGASWSILAVDAETPSDVSLLAAVYGKGRFVFNTNNFYPQGSDPGSDQHLVQLVDWAGSSAGADWSTAYRHLFEHSSDVELMRTYRDRVLCRKAKGRKFKRLIYKNSREALAVLRENPELMAQLKDLIYANQDAVRDVTLGYRGTIYNTRDIAAFLDAYAKKAPPKLRFLAKMIKRQMLRKQRRGKPFFGFRLE